MQTHRERTAQQHRQQTEMDNLLAGTVISYSYDAGSKPGHTRTAVFRNYNYDSKGMYCDDGTLKNGQCKLFLLKNVRNLLIEDEVKLSFQVALIQW